MYFLNQIRSQFFSQLFAFQGDGAGQPADAAEFLDGVDNLEEAKEYIDALEASEKIVSTHLNILGNFLLKVKNGQVDGLSDQDKEFEVLYDKFLRKKVEYEGLSDDARATDLGFQEMLDKVEEEIIEELPWVEKLTEEQQTGIKELMDTREKAQDAFKAQLDIVRAQNPNIAQQFENVLKNSETGFEGDASFEDGKNMIMRDIDTLESASKNLELQVKLMEDPADTEARHALLDGVFENLNEEDKEGLLGDSIETLTAGDIYSMKARGIDLASVFLVTPEGQLSAGKDAMNSGDRFKVNFGISDAADKIIGAGDVFPIDQIYSVKINGVEGIRRFEPRPGYYTPGGRYLAIHDGYSVEIGEKKEVTPDELKALETARQERFEDMRSGDIAQIINSLEGENPEVPFRHEADIAILEKLLKDTGIQGLSYNTETKTIDTPDGMTFGDVKEVMNGYPTVKKDLIGFISQAIEDGKVHTISDGETLTLEGIDYSQILLEGAIQSLIGSSLSDDVSFDYATMTITTTGEVKIADILGGDYEYKGNGTRHLRYIGAVRDAAAKYGVPVGAIIQLIYHENRGWNPTISAPGSSAYGLGQMIDSTWATYGKGLNRHNPADQLMATARYMAAIQEKKNCPWEHVLAYYNTGEGINSVSLSKVREFARLNPAITSKIPGGITAVTSPRVYFTGAVAYYNNMSFEQAKATL